MDCNKMGKLIATKRKEKNLTQQQLGNMLKITDRAVSKWERGICCPDISLLNDLSQILGISITELLSGEMNYNLTTDKVDKTITESLKEYIKLSHNQKLLKTMIIIPLAMSILYIIAMEIIRYYFFHTFQNTIWTLKGAIVLIGGFLGCIGINGYILSKIQQDKEIFLKTLKIILILYLLTIFISMFFRTSIYTEPSYNIIPLATIKENISLFLSGTQPFATLEGLILNILLFMPIGTILPMLNKKKSLKKLIIITLILALSKELIQYFIIKGGIFDIDMILLNILGVILGYNIVIIFLDKRKNYGSEKYQIDL